MLASLVILHALNALRWHQLQLLAKLYKPVRRHDRHIFRIPSQVPYLFFVHHIHGAASLRAKLRKSQLKAHVVRALRKLQRIHRQRPAAIRNPRDQLQQRICTWFKVLVPHILKSFRFVSPWCLVANLLGCCYRGNLFGFVTIVAWSLRLHCDTVSQCRFLSMLMIWMANGSQFTAVGWTLLAWTYPLFPPSVQATTHDQQGDASTIRSAPAPDVSCTSRHFETFVPLRNFLPGSLDFNNTCFIAATLQLSAWIPAIHAAALADRVGRLPWNEALWKEVITRIRTRWNRKYQWTAANQGRDDAAELLSDLLWQQQPGNFAAVGVRKFCVFGCRHEYSQRLDEPMAVLQLPPVTSSSSVHEMHQQHTIRSLLQHHGQAEDIDIVECQECQREGKPKRNDRGRSARSYEFHNDIIIFRINRPPGQGGALSMRKDPVVPEMVLEFADVFYDLVAVVEHDGDTVNDGHYEAVIRSENGWQRRSDCTLKRVDDVPVLRYPNIYVVVYAKRHLVLIRDREYARRAQAQEAERRRQAEIETIREEGRKRAAAARAARAAEEQAKREQLQKAAAAAKLAEEQKKQIEEDKRRQAAAEAELHKLQQERKRQQEDERQRQEAAAKRLSEDKALQEEKKRKEADERQPDGQRGQQGDAIEAEGTDPEGGIPNGATVKTKSQQWMSMFNIRVRANRDRKPEPDLLREAAAQVATSLLRDHVTMPADLNNPAESMTDANTGGALPLVNCACVGCTWSMHLRDMPEDRGDENTSAVEQTFRHDEELGELLLGNIRPR